MKKRTSKMSMGQQFRSCAFCHSVDGLEISGFQQAGDAIYCQVCGVQYLIESMLPLILFPIDGPAVHGDDPKRVSEY